MSSLSENILEELVSQFPPLWNPQDVHFRDKSMRSKCLQQLLEKCQSMSAVPVTLDTLKRKLSGVLKRRSRCDRSKDTSEHRTSTNKAGSTHGPAAKRHWTHRMDELAAEFPCLWDLTDLSYSDREIKAKCRQQLLEKYNKVASVPITVASLKKKLAAMRRRLAYGTRKNKEVAGPSGEESRDELSDLETSSDSNAPVTDQIRWVFQSDPTQQPPGILTLVFHCCCFCGEVKNDCTDVTDKPYVTNMTIPWLRPRKTTLIFNELTVSLDFDNESTPKTVCQSCDTKMKEFNDFIKLVKKAQDKMNPAEPIEICDDDDDDDKKNDDITVTDTEIVNTNKRKRSDAEKKTCSVTIDLNPPPDDDINKMVDIETKYKMFKRDGVSIATATVTSTASDKVVSNVKDITEDTDHNVIVDVKEEIEGDTYTNREMGTLVSNAQNKSIVESTLNTENSTISNKIATISNIVSLDPTHNGNADVASSSVVSEQKSKNEVCVIPKTELIQLVESIVSRMLNK